VLASSPSPQRAEHSTTEALLQTTRLSAPGGPLPRDFQWSLPQPKSAPSVAGTIQSWTRLMTSCLVALLLRGAVRVPNASVVATSRSPSPARCLLRLPRVLRRPWVLSYLSFSAGRLRLHVGYDDVSGMDWPVSTPTERCPAGSAVAWRLRPPGAGSRLGEPWFCATSDLVAATSTPPNASSRLWLNDSLQSSPRSQTRASRVRCRQRAPRAARRQLVQYCPAAAGSQLRSQPT
jgi:hypothetical protein